MKRASKARAKKGSWSNLQRLDSCQAIFNHATFDVRCHYVEKSLRDEIARLKMRVEEADSRAEEADSRAEEAVSRVNGYQRDMRRIRQRACFTWDVQ